MRELKSLKPAIKQPVKQEQPKRRLFRDREHQLLRPTVTVYHS